MLSIMCSCSLSMWPFCNRILSSLFSYASYQNDANDVIIDQSRPSALTSIYPAFRVDMRMPIRYP